MRPSRDDWALELVRATAKRSTCLRRQVGCVLLSARGHVLATGYNGVAAGLPHCNEVTKITTGPCGGKVWGHACSGAHSASGTNLDGCQAIHAEQNALLQCKDVYEIDTCYVSASPCMTCVKLLLNTGCTRIVFIDEYPHKEAGTLWTQNRGASGWVLDGGKLPF